MAMITRQLNKRQLKKLQKKQAQSSGSLAVDLSYQSSLTNDQATAVELRLVNSSDGGSHGNDVVRLDRWMRDHTPIRNQYVRIFYDNEDPMSFSVPRYRARLSEVRDKFVERSYRSAKQRETQAKASGSIRPIRLPKCEGGDKYLTSGLPIYNGSRGESSYTYLQKCFVFTKDNTEPTLLDSDWDESMYTKHDRVSDKEYMKCALTDKNMRLLNSGSLYHKREDDDHVTMEQWDMSGDSIPWSETGEQVEFVGPDTNYTSSQTTRGGHLSKLIKDLDQKLDKIQATNQEQLLDTRRTLWNVSALMKEQLNANDLMHRQIISLRDEMYLMRESVNAVHADLVHLNHKTFERHKHTSIALQDLEGVVTDRTTETMRAVHDLSATVDAGIQIKTADHDQQQQHLESIRLEKYDASNQEEMYTLAKERKTVSKAPLIDRLEQRGDPELVARYYASRKMCMSLSWMNYSYHESLIRRGEWNDQGSTADYLFRQSLKQPVVLRSNRKNYSTKYVKSEMTLPVERTRSEVGVDVPKPAPMKTFRVRELSPRKRMKLMAKEVHQLAGRLTASEIKSRFGVLVEKEQVITGEKHYHREQRKYCQLIKGLSYHHPQDWLYNDDISQAKGLTNWLRFHDGMKDTYMERRVWNKHSTDLHQHDQYWYHKWLEYNCVFNPERSTEVEATANESVFNAPHIWIPNLEIVQPPSWHRLPVPEGYVRTELGILMPETGDNYIPVYTVEQANAELRAMHSGAVKHNPIRATFLNEMLRHLSSTSVSVSVPRNYRVGTRSELQDVRKRTAVSRLVNAIAKQGIRKLSPKERRVTFFTELFNNASIESRIEWRREHYYHQLADIMEINNRGAERRRFFKAEADLKAQREANDRQRTQSITQKVSGMMDNVLDNVFGAAREIKGIFNDPLIV